MVNTSHNLVCIAILNIQGSAKTLNLGKQTTGHPGHTTFHGSQSQSPHELWNNYSLPNTYGSHFLHRTGISHNYDEMIFNHLTRKVK